MLFRFSLYGFLKNQKYYEPFIIFAFIEKGLTFFEIGLLVGFRELCVNLLEVPSGGVADLYGKRRAMILSFLSYIASFLVFALSSSFTALFGAMFLFSIGEAFRTGTHKAMIFEWLRIGDRADQKTVVYGFTRSWSQIGSAVSVLIASAIVLWSGNYSRIFLYSALPYLIGIVNFLGYPSYLDGEHVASVSVRSVFVHLLRTVRTVWKSYALRRTLVESMVQDGTYNTAKDYLQPILKQAALAMPVLLYLQDQERTAVLVGAVYFTLHLVSSYASRLAHRFSAASGGELPASRRLWAVELLVFLAMVPLFVFDHKALLIAAFVLLALIQNVWRPILLARIDTTSDPSMGATILSVESQAKSLFVMGLAPLLGYVVDLIATPHLKFLPVAIFGLIAVGTVLATTGRNGTGSPAASS